MEKISVSINLQTSSLVWVWGTGGIIKIFQALAHLYILIASTVCDQSYRSSPAELLCAGSGAIPAPGAGPGADKRTC